MDTSSGLTQQTSYFPVSPLMLFPDVMGDFSFYLWQEGDFVLYARGGELFTHKQRTKLIEAGVKELFVRSSRKTEFEQYVEQNLGRILEDDHAPLGERSRVLYEATSLVIQDVFNQKLPASLSEQHLERIQAIVRDSVRFLAKDKTLAAIAPFIAHDYRTYTHSIHVFIYSNAMLRTYIDDEDMLFECGLGAILHDVGKTRIDKTILNKRGSLTQDERVAIKDHPLYGVSACSHLPISQNTINCILFHHERLDGSGYPAGLASDHIPLPVRLVTLADIYDALTTNRPYAEGMPPYEALTLIRHEMRSQIDMNCFRRFVELLSGANLVQL